jgi:hypothetical protein
MTNNNPHIGSSFDDFLDEENLLVEANEIAIKRVIDNPIGAFLKGAFEGWENVK